MKTILFRSLSFWEICRIYDKCNFAYFLKDNFGCYDGYKCEYANSFQYNNYIWYLIDNIPINKRNVFKQNLHLILYKQKKSN